MKESRDVRGLAIGLALLFLCPVLFLLVMSSIDDAIRSDEDIAVEEEQTPVEGEGEGAPTEGTPAEGTEGTPAEPTEEGTPTEGTEGTPAEPSEEGTPAEGTPAEGTEGESAPTNDPNMTPSPVSFQRDIVPIFELHCYTCHGPDRVPGIYTTYSLANYDATLRGGFMPAVVPGRPEESSLYQGLHSGSMPRGAPRLSEAEIELVRQWILQGASDN
jgi:hypothetical protein